MRVTRTVTGALSVPTRTPWRCSSSIIRSAFGELVLMKYVFLPPSICEWMAS